MSGTSQHLISSFCRTCLQQLPCESSYNLFVTPGLSKKLSVCTSLSVEQQDGFPDNICGVCYTRLNEMHDFQEQCVDAVQKFQDMLRLVSVNEVKAPSGFEKSHNKEQETNGIKNEIIISNNPEDININSKNSMKKIIEFEKVVLGTVEKIEIEETQIIQENFNKKGVKPQYNEITHTRGKKYECDTCEKKFPKLRYLKDHKNIHTGEKPYVCKTCKKEFSHRNYLKSHEMIHSGEKRHKCETCGKCFLRAWDLTLHGMTHTSEKPHICKTCGKSYKWYNTLKYHEKTHTTESVCVCKTCGKKFSRPDYLNLHERRHSKPFKCDICLKGFVRGFELKRHKMTHTGESPFVCQTCGKGFKVKQSLQIHQMKCTHVSCNESEESGKSKFKNEMEHDSPVSSDMDEQEFISISSK